MGAIPDFRLGLIGDNITRSKAPALHRLAGNLCGLRVTYDRLEPRDLECDFDTVFDRCRADGYRGINVTHPYKEKAAARVKIDDPAVRQIGAVNTVVFEPDGPKGFNTDFTGIIAAYREVFGGAAPAPVCLVGAGGAGKAVAFGLIALGLEEIRISDHDPTKAERLAEALRAACPSVRASAAGSLRAAASGAHGLINCTPVGMTGDDGTPIGQELMAGAKWAFDAVYTPVDTRFLRDAEAAGLAVISGYELFFHQGVDAFKIFCGHEVDQPSLRAALLGEAM